MKISIKYLAALMVALGVLSEVALASSPPVPIYGEDSAPVGLTKESQQIIVGIITILIFVFMAMEMFSPVTLLFSSLIICMMLQILTLPETLAGMKILFPYSCT